MGRHSREPRGGRTTKEKSKPSPATQGSDYKVLRAAKGTEIGCGAVGGPRAGLLDTRTVLCNGAVWPWTAEMLTITEPHS